MKNSSKTIAFLCLAAVAGLTQAADVEAQPRLRRAPAPKPTSTARPTVAKPPAAITKPIVFRPITASAQLRSALAGKKRVNTRSQIPLLGSLPWIGAAFRFDTETDQRRELLVVLTPRIIQTDEDYETVKTIASSRMSWCLADVLNVHGDVGLTGGNGLWGPARSTTIYPDMQPTVIEDHAVPHSGQGFPHQPYDPGVPNMIEGYPQGTESSSVIEPAQLPSFNADAKVSPAGSTFRSAGYVTPAVAPPLPNEASVQRTPY